MGTKGSDPGVVCVLKEWPGSDLGEDTNQGGPLPWLIYSDRKQRIEERIETVESRRPNQRRWTAEVFRH